MTVLALTAIGVASALWSPRRVRRMAELRLDHVWLVWAAFLTQVVVLQWCAAHMPVWAVETIHFGDLRARRALHRRQPPPPGVAA